MIKKKLIICIYILVLTHLFAGCKDDIEIQKDYPFSVTHLPVTKRLALGETAEIRFEIQREEMYENTKYFIRYFQTDGLGELMLDNGTVLMPNDLYELEKEVFRIYFTCLSQEQQKIDLYFLDSFGNMQVVSFSFSYYNKG